MALTLNEMLSLDRPDGAEPGDPVHEWAVPAVADGSILSDSVVASSALMVDLRLIGVFLGDRRSNDVMSRFPAVWCPCSSCRHGVIMIIAERQRLPEKPAFQLRCCC